MPIRLEQQLWSVLRQAVNAIHGLPRYIPCKPFMLVLGTLLVLTGALGGVGLLAWLVPSVEPDGTRCDGLGMSRMSLTLRRHKGSEPKP